MFRFKTPYLFLLLGLIASVDSFAATPLCISTNGGFGAGGTTYIAPGYVLPAVGSCSPWSGFTKTAVTVVLTTSGTVCLSSDGQKLTISVSNADPDFLGGGQIASDYMELPRSTSTGKIGNGADTGYFGDGTAQSVTCTSNLLYLHETHD